MQCPSCSKFAPKDTDTEPEGELEVDENGMVTGEIRIVNTSECCGEELEETNFTVEIDLTEEVRQHMEEKHANVLAKRAAPKPTKVEPIDPKTLGMFDYCKNCKRYWSSHRTTDRKGALVTVMSANVRLADARKARCVEGGTSFEPKSGSVSKKGNDVELSVDADITRTDETPRTDRNGKTIKSSRYMKRFYGIAVSATVHCDACNTDIAGGTYADHVQASGMDSLV